MKINRKYAWQLVIIVFLLKLLGKFGPAPWFFTFEQSFLFVKQQKGNFSHSFTGSGSTLRKQMDPDPKREKLLDLDPQKRNAVPQPCLN